MSPKSLCFAVLVAIFAVFASRVVINPFPQLQVLDNIADFGITISFSSSFVAKFIPFNFDNLHRHHKHPDKGKPVSVCDDFPPNFPPPETNTTLTLCVDQNGCCNFTKVQAAVDAVPNLSIKRTVIWINSGIYYEKVIIPKTKPNITFQGQGYTSTAIAWNDTALSANGTSYSGSVQVFSTNFIAKNISFMNVAPIPRPGYVGAQAVAIRIAGDQAAFWGCGSVDFIFGNGKSLYEQDCQMLSMANPVAPGSKSISGAVTAHGRASADENSGFAFVNCSVGGTGRIWLGRAWRPFSRVVFAFTYMADIIAPEGWNNFKDPTRDQTIFYGEYNCRGAGANMSGRTPYVQRLNDTQASLFLSTSFIDGDQWLLSYDT
ncbi:hypothetical protein like AT1G05310 [Hibiscus trionum]|uniref:pectinesterase n=1 Tax=Hibiscus trionum TaxID=183268 RepID=A0A9W7LSY5_HIBTR|nr:hypothetical protein like AT1G05310 [Hibiscus trionum]